MQGGSVVVKCFYPPTAVNRHDRKYWCRQVGARCATKVSSNYVDPGYEGRISLSDHPEEENFQINISALALSDAGTFQCGVGVNGRGLSHRVVLSIAEGNYNLKNHIFFEFLFFSFPNEAPPRVCGV